MVEKKSAGSAVLWMREDVEAIDKQFGAGYASAPPELVADSETRATAKGRNIAIARLAVSLPCNTAQDG